MKSYYKYEFGNYNLFQIPALIDSYNNYVYMITEGSKAWVFDPAELSPIEKTLSDNSLNLQGILITHHHGDHIGCTDKLKKKWNCPVYGYEKDLHRIPCITHKVNVDDQISIGSMTVTVHDYPGHTVGLIAYYVKDQNWIFSNDLIFSLGCGRVFEGTSQQMHSSLKKLAQLPDETLLMISHEYTKSNLDFGLSVFPNDKKLLSIKNDILKKINSNLPTVPTTLKYEKEHNPFMRWADPEIRQTLDGKDLKDWEVFAQIRARKDVY